MIAPCVLAEDCSRIVSIAPSVTELLFELELGESLAGVTRYCNYPEQARSKEKVGGFLDLNLEKIIALEPTIVIGLREQTESLLAVSKLGIGTLQLNHSKLAGILSSISQVGLSCSRKEVAQRLLKERNDQISLAKTKAQKLSAQKQPRVLIAVGRGDANDLTHGVYVSGSDGYYSEILELLGAKNINTGTTASFPLISAEGVINADPEIIIEIVAPEVRERLSQDTLKLIWGKFPSVAAVQTDRLHLISDDFASIPGPRLHLLLNKFMEILWSAKI